MKGLTLLGLALALSAQMAFATATLRLTNGASTVTVTDNGVGDLDGATGQVIFSGAVGVWNINITSGLSTGPGVVEMDLGSIDATASGPSTLVIEWSDQSFNLPSPSFHLDASGTLLSGSGTAKIDAWFDNGNSIFGHGGYIAGLGPFSTSYSSAIDGGGPGVPLYSMTEQVTLTAAAGGVKWSTDTGLTTVPEPGAVMLLGSVLVLCASALRRKRVS